MNGLSALTDRLLSGLAAAPITGADSASEGALRGLPLAPSPNVTGLAQPAPLMLTTLSALAPLQHGWTGRPDESGRQPLGARTETQPISAIRVRVHGVTGVDEVSRERVRLVADRIRAETGLEVDVTVGSSPYEQRINLPGGQLGRPDLVVQQSWLKKGVATTILKALDRKSLAVFSLVLLVSILSVANSTVASVRARRRELGLLSCLGWRGRDLFRCVMAELLLIAGGAGVAAAAAAGALGWLLRVPVPLSRAGLAVPAALLVATLAGLGPAWAASRVSPIKPQTCR